MKTLKLAIPILALAGTAAAQSEYERAMERCGSIADATERKTCLTNFYTEEEQVKKLVRDPASVPDAAPSLVERARLLRERRETETAERKKLEWSKTGELIVLGRNMFGRREIDPISDDRLSLISLHSIEDEGGSLTISKEKDRLFVGIAWSEPITAHRSLQVTYRIDAGKPVTEVWNITEFKFSNKPTMAAALARQLRGAKKLVARTTKATGGVVDATFDLTEIEIAFEYLNYRWSPAPQQELLCLLGGSNWSP